MRQGLVREAEGGAHILEMRADPTRLSTPSTTAIPHVAVLASKLAPTIGPLSESGL